ncbi:hypothetical protein EQ500_00270 [Lactobacillus sp. XV13L]|nr:hypothetical protein [Lactobacillus sp. XV13L]
MKLKKIAVAATAAVMLSPLAAALKAPQAVQAAAGEAAPSEIDRTFTNKEIFKALEDQGFNVKAILGAKEYQAALRDDLKHPKETIIKFANKDIFAALRAGGFNARKVLGKKAYQAALKQDKKKNGKSYIEVNEENDDGVVVYLSKPVVKLIAAGGTVAVIGNGLNHLIPDAAAVRSIISIVPGAIKNVKKSRGLYLKFNKDGSLGNWSYHRYEL